MEDFTFYQKYFSDLYHSSRDINKKTINGYGLDEFDKYKKTMWEQYNNFENELEKVLLLTDINKQHLFNLLYYRLEEVRKILEHLRWRHNGRKQGPFIKIKDVTEIINDAPKLRNELSKDPNLNENHIEYQISRKQLFEYGKLFIEHQLSLVERTERCIKSKLKINSSTIFEDEIKEPIVNESLNPDTNIDVPVKSFNETSKLVINMSKSNIALTFIFLCEAGIIKINKKSELNNFIESNFKYIDNSQNKSKLSDIVKINTEFSRLVDGQKSRVNNKKLEEILENYRIKIDEFFDNISINLENYRNRK